MGRVLWAVDPDLPGRAEDLVPLQKLVCDGQYGPGMAELEQQVAEHNILQREIEAYGHQLRILVGPVSASLSRPVWSPPTSCHSQATSLAFERWMLVGNHHTAPCFSLAPFLSLVEAGCSHHQEPIPRPPGELEDGWDWVLFASNLPAWGHCC